MSQLYIGCCGFPIGRRNYYRHFRCVEVQQTFYHPPRTETLERWRHESSDDFHFTLKAWQLITHPPHSRTYRRLRMEIPDGKSGQYGNFRPTQAVFEAWQRTYEAANILRTQLVVFQSPPSFHSTSQNKQNMKKFFQTIDRHQLLLGWEPRGWDDYEAGDLCRELELFHIVDPFQAKSFSSKVTYWRLHGVGGYRYRYSDIDLDQLARWIPKDTTVYLMFNNLSMFQDGLRFKERCYRGEGGETTIPRA